MPKFAELKRELRKAGCRFDHDGGNHEIWYSPITDDYFPVSRHDKQEVPRGTEHSIRKKSGVKRK